MNLLVQSLQSKDIPNLLLYGCDIENIERNLFTSLNKLYTTTPLETITKKDIIYEKNNLYYIFNCLTIHQDIESFIDIIKEIIQNKNFFGELENKIIIFNNFIKIKTSLQNILRVSLEKYRETTVFILLTNKYDGIIEPIKSRCLCIRIPSLNKSEKRQIMYKNMKLSEINTQILDHVYEINDGEDVIRQFLKYNFILSDGFQTPYDKICKKIIHLYRKKVYNKRIHEKLSDYSYNILKFSLNIRYFYYIFLSYLLKENIRDTKKYKLIYLLADSEYNFIRSYRSIIILESLLLNVFKIYNL